MKKKFEPCKYNRQLLLLFWIPVLKHNSSLQYFQVREYELSREFDASPSPTRQVYNQQSGSSTSHRVEYTVKQRTRTTTSSASSASRQQGTRLEDNFVVSKDASTAAAPPSLPTRTRSSKHALINSLMHKYSKRRYKKNRRGRKMATRKWDYSCKPCFSSYHCMSSFA